MKEHHFYIEEAEKYGIEKAILLYNIRFWLDKNKANGKNIHDGMVWTYNSAKAFGELFPYMKSKSISRWLLELERDGVLLSSKKYNKNKYDKTKWYTLPAEYLISQNEEWIPQNEQSTPQNEESISQNEQPIPDSKPNKKTNTVNTYSNSKNIFFDFSVDELDHRLSLNQTINRKDVTPQQHKELLALGYKLDKEQNYYY